MKNVINFKKMFENRTEVISKCEKCGGLDDYNILINASIQNDEKQYINVIQKNFKWFNKNIIKKFDNCNDFKNGFARVENNDKWGYIDSYGNMFTKLIYNYCSDFSNELASVQINDKWGFINSNGNMLTDFIYDDCDDFSNELATVKINDKWGYLNSDGNMFTNFIYDVCSDFKNGIARVKINGKWGFLNSNKIFTPDI